MKLANTLLAFLIGCMGARLLLAFLAKQANKKWLRIMGYIAILPVFGSMYFFFTGVRNNVGASGEKVWWNYLRPVHAVLFSLFAYFAIVGNRNAWVYLLIDALTSLFGFVWFHSRNGDFSKAFL
jgi:hypothetical protein